MIPDVQTRAPDIRLPLTRVGVSNVRKMIRVPQQGKRDIVLLVNLSCFVDLPSSQKGTHMSRDLEAINEIMEDIVKKPVYEVEGLCESVAKQVIKKHDYATKCEVTMESKLMMPRKTPSGEKVQDFIKLIARAEAYHDEKQVRKEVGAEIKGMIVYPSKSNFGGSSQKASASLMIEVPKGYFIKIGDIVSILENSMSAKTLEYGTDADEESVIGEAYKKPRYADTVVEEALKKSVKTFMLPGNVRVTAKCTVEDSLFPHSMYVKMSAKAGEVKSS